MADSTRDGPTSGADGTGDDDVTDEINDADATVIAVDVPSGVDADTGEVTMRGEVFGPVTALTHDRTLLVGTESGEVYDLFPHHGELTGLWRRKVGGRVTSVLLAYPFAMTAIFLPPVVAALLTPSISDIVLDPSYELARWILDTFLAIGGINETLRGAFDLETFGAQWGIPGLGYVLMWVGISIPLGWFLGLLVSFADLIRPKPDD